jgi:hypothetical protein
MKFKHQRDHTKKEREARRKAIRRQKKDERHRQAWEGFDKGEEENTDSDPATQKH